MALYDWLVEVFVRSGAAGVLAGVMAAVLVSCGCTFVFTTSRFRVRSMLYESAKYQGREPPTLPYYIPWLGSTLFYLANPHGFMKSAMCVQSLFRWDLVPLYYQSLTEPLMSGPNRRTAISCEYVLVLYTYIYSPARGMCRNSSAVLAASILRILSFS
jgi:hypothetical protein